MEDANATYDKKLTEMKKYLPFLENMENRLKTAHGEGLGIQLPKIQGLKNLLLSSKRMKMENLIKCEQVLLKLYQKTQEKPSVIVDTNTDTKRDEDKSTNVVHSKEEKSSVISVPPSLNFYKENQTETVGIPAVTHTSKINKVSSFGNIHQNQSNLIDIPIKNITPIITKPVCNNINVNLVPVSPVLDKKEITTTAQSSDQIKVLNENKKEFDIFPEAQILEKNTVFQKMLPPKTETSKSQLINDEQSLLKKDDVSNSTTDNLLCILINNRSISKKDHESTTELKDSRSYTAPNKCFIQNTDVNKEIIKIDSNTIREENVRCIREENDLGKEDFQSVRARLKKVVETSGDAKDNHIEKTTVKSFEKEIELVTSAYLKSSTSEPSKLISTQHNSETKNLNENCTESSNRLKPVVEGYPKRKFTRVLISPVRFPVKYTDEYKYRRHRSRSPSSEKSWRRRSRSREDKKYRRSRSRDSKKYDRRSKSRDSNRRSNRETEYSSSRHNKGRDYVSTEKVFSKGSPKTVSQQSSYLSPTRNTKDMLEKQKNKDIKVIEKKIEKIIEINELRRRRENIVRQLQEETMIDALIDSDNIKNESSSKKIKGDKEDGELGESDEDIEIIYDDLSVSPKELLEKDKLEKKNVKSITLSLPDPAVSATTTNQNISNTSIKINLRNDILQISEKLEANIIQKENTIVNRKFQNENTISHETISQKSKKLIDKMAEIITSEISPPLNKDSIEICDLRADISVETVCVKNDSDLNIVDTKTDFDKDILKALADDTGTNLDSVISNVSFDKRDLGENNKKNISNNTQITNKSRRISLETYKEKHSTLNNKNEGNLSIENKNYKDLMHRVFSQKEIEKFKSILPKPLDSDVLSVSCNSLQRDYRMTENPTMVFDTSHVEPESPDSNNSFTYPKSPLEEKTSVEDVCMGANKNEKNPHSFASIDTTNLPPWATPVHRNAEAFQPKRNVYMGSMNLFNSDFKKSSDMNILSPPYNTVAINPENNSRQLVNTFNYSQKSEMNNLQQSFNILGTNFKEQIPLLNLPGTNPRIGNINQSPRNDQFCDDKQTMPVILRNLNSVGLSSPQHYREFSENRELAGNRMSNIPGQLIVSQDTDKNDVKPFLLNTDGSPHVRSRDFHNSGRAITTSIIPSSMKSEIPTGLRTQSDRSTPDANLFYSGSHNINVPRTPIHEPNFWQPGKNDALENHARRGSWQTLHSDNIGQPFNQEFNVPRTPIHEPSSWYLSNQKHIQEGNLRKPNQRESTPGRQIYLNTSGGCTPVHETNFSPLFTNEILQRPQNDSFGSCTPIHEPNWQYTQRDMNFTRAGNMQVPGSCTPIHEPNNWHARHRESSVARSVSSETQFIAPIIRNPDTWSPSGDIDPRNVRHREPSVGRHSMASNVQMFNRDSNSWYQAQRENSIGPSIRRESSLGPSFSNRGRFQDHKNTNQQCNTENSIMNVNKEFFQREQSVGRGTLRDLNTGIMLDRTKNYQRAQSVGRLTSYTRSKSVGRSFTREQSIGRSFVSEKRTFDSDFKDKSNQRSRSVGRSIHDDRSFNRSRSVGRNFSQKNDDDLYLRNHNLEFKNFKYDSRQSKDFKEAYSNIRKNEQENKLSDNDKKSNKTNFIQNKMFDKDPRVRRLYERNDSNISTNERNVDQGSKGSLKREKNNDRSFEKHRDPRLQKDKNDGTHSKSQKGKHYGRDPRLQKEQNDGTIYDEQRQRSKDRHHRRFDSKSSYKVDHKNIKKSQSNSSYSSKEKVLSFKIPKIKNVESTENQLKDIKNLDKSETKNYSRDSYTKQEREKDSKNSKSLNRHRRESIDKDLVNISSTKSEKYKSRNSKQEEPSVKSKNIRVSTEDSDSIKSLNVNTDEKFMNRVEPDDDKGSFELTNQKDPRISLKSTTKNRQEHINKNNDNRDGRSSDDKESLELNSNQRKSLRSCQQKSLERIHNEKNSPNKTKESSFGTIVSSRKTRQTTKLESIVCSKSDICRNTTETNEIEPLDNKESNDLQQDKDNIEKLDQGISLITDNILVSSSDKKKYSQQNTTKSDLSPSSSDNLPKISEDLHLSINESPELRTENVSNEYHDIDMRIELKQNTLKNESCSTIVVSTEKNDKPLTNVKDQSQELNTTITSNLYDVNTGSDKEDASKCQTSCDDVSSLEKSIDDKSENTTPVNLREKPKDNISAISGLVEILKDKNKMLEILALLGEKGDISDKIKKRLAKITEIDSDDDEADGEKSEKSNEIVSKSLEITTRTLENATTDKNDDSVFIDGIQSETANAKNNETSGDILTSESSIADLNKDDSPELSIKKKSSIEDSTSVEQTSDNRTDSSITDKDSEINKIIMKKVDSTTSVEKTPDNCTDSSITDKELEINVIMPKKADSTTSVEQTSDHCNNSSITDKESEVNKNILEVSIDNNSPVEPQKSEKKRKYTRGNRELEMLHEYNFGMFISQDVLKATGVRACTLSTLDSQSHQNVTDTILKIPDKKKNLRSSKLSKPEKKIDFNKTIDKVSDKTPIVILEKTDNLSCPKNIIIDYAHDSNTDVYDYEDDTSELHGYESVKQKPCPKSKKIFQPNAMENDNTVQKITCETVSEQSLSKKTKSGLKGKVTKKSSKVTSSPVVTKSLTENVDKVVPKIIKETSSLNKPLPKKKKRFVWKTGIIRKKNKKCSNQTIVVKALKPVNYTDKIYSFSSNTNEYKCKLCSKYKGIEIVRHYKKCHPHSEVLISRLNSDQAKNAIEEFNNGFPNDTSISKKMRSYRCRFCMKLFKVNNFRSIFDHITQHHTGEYKCECSICARSKIKSCVSVCNKSSTLPLVTDFGSALKGYICSICNYTQVSRENLKTHISLRHSGKECELYEINLILSNVRRRRNNGLLEVAHSEDVQIQNKILTRSQQSIENENTKKLRPIRKVTNRDNSKKVERDLLKTLDSAHTVSELSNSQSSSDAQLSSSQGSSDATLLSCHESSDGQLSSSQGSSDVQLSHIQSSSNVKLDSVDTSSEPAKNLILDQALKGSNDQKPAIDVNQENVFIPKISEKSIEPLSHVNNSLNEAQSENSIKIKQEPICNNQDANCNQVNNNTPLIQVKEENSFTACDIKNSSVDATNTNDTSILGAPCIDVKPINQSVTRVGCITRKQTGIGAEYLCSIDKCEYSNSLIFLFIRHIENVHNYDYWDGFCGICNELVIQGGGVKYTSALDHLLKSHVNEDGTTNSANNTDNPKHDRDLLSRPIKQEVTPAVEASEFVPKIQVRSLTDMLAPQDSLTPRISTSPPPLQPISATIPVTSDIAPITSKTPELTTNFGLCHLRIENVVSLNPNIEDPSSSKDDQKNLPDSPKRQPIVNSNLPSPSNSDSTPKTVSLPDPAPLQQKLTSLRFYKPNSLLFKCSAQCNFSTDNIHEYVIHLRTAVHPPDVNAEPSWTKCTYCKFSSDTVIVIADHILKEHGACRFECPLCVYRAAVPLLVVTHALAAHRIKIPAVGEVRPNPGAGEGALIQGLKSKLSCVPLYVCTNVIKADTVCDGKFFSPESFINHLQEHGEKYCKCSICSSNILTGRIIQHMRMVHNFKLLTCPYCSDSFNAQTEALGHLALQHPARRPLLYLRIRTTDKVTGLFDDKVVLLNLDKNEYYKNTMKAPNCEETSDPVSAKLTSFEFLKIVSTEKEYLEKFNSSNTSCNKSSSDKMAIITKIATSNSNSKENTQKKPAAVGASSKCSPAILKKRTGISNNDEIPIKITTPREKETEQPTVTIKKNTSNKKIPEVSIPTTPKKKETPSKLVEQPLIIINKKTSNKTIPEVSVNTTTNEEVVADKPSVKEVRMPESVDVIISLDSDEEDNVPLAKVGNQSKDQENVLKENETPKDISVDHNVSKVVEEKSDSEFEVEFLDDNFSDSNKTSSTKTIVHGKFKQPEKCFTLFSERELINLVKPTGFSGKELFKCGNSECLYSAATSSEFKDHLRICENAKELDKLPCFHCKRKFKYNSNLLEHIRFHGTYRFQCNICFQISYGHQSVGQHMKKAHKVNAWNIVPVNPFKKDYDVDFFILKSIDSSIVKMKKKPGPKPKVSVVPSAPQIFKKNVFGPDEVDNLPLNPILPIEIYCKVCSFGTKVRSNMLRHLQMHANEIAVPSVAPINPVPHLETNEMHFDKMANLALSSNIDKPLTSRNLDRKEKAEAKLYSEKKNVPKFVLEKDRFVCGSSGCRYISVDEMMLRYHWEALHPEETVFHCTHCGEDISEGNRALSTGNIAAHLRLHEETLFGCEVCNFMHPSSRCVERHSGEAHGRPTCQSLRDPLPQDELGEMELKSWQCSLCSTRATFKTEIIEHCKNIHNIRNPYKCSMCSFSYSNQSVFPSHFNIKHSGKPVEIITIYFKGNTKEETVPAPVPVPVPDNTPLWWKQRKRPSSFNEESQSPVPTAELDKVPPPKKSKRNSTSERIATPPAVSSFPDFGLPHQDRYMCPFCSNFTTSLYIDMKLHLYEEMDYRKWACTVCGYKSFSSTKISQHSTAAHRVSKSLLLPLDPIKENWIENCLISQEKYIAAFKQNQKEKIANPNANLAPTSQENKEKNVEEIDDEDQSRLVINEPDKQKNKKCPHCDFESATGLNLHIKRHWKIKPLKCGYCSHGAVRKIELRHHITKSHPHEPYCEIRNILPDVPEILQLERKRPSSDKGNPPVGVSSPKKSKSVSSLKTHMCLQCEHSLSEDEISTHNMTCDKGLVFMKHTIVVKCCICMQLTTDVYFMTCHFEKEHPGLDTNYVMHKLGNPKTKRIINKQSVSDTSANIITSHKISCGYCQELFYNYSNFISHHNSTHLVHLIRFIPLTIQTLEESGEIKQNIPYNLNECCIVGCNYVADTHGPTQIMYHVRSHYISYKCHFCCANFTTYSSYNLHSHLHPGMTVKSKDTFINNTIIQDRLVKLYTKFKQIHPTLSGDEHSYINMDVTDEYIVSETISSSQGSDSDCLIVPDLLPTIQAPSVPQKKQVARKSTTYLGDFDTSSRSNTDYIEIDSSSTDNESPSLESVSYYGKKPAKIDLKKISVEMNFLGSVKKITVDKLETIENLSPCVEVQDLKNKKG